MENSKIQWCHHTFNPWRGCTKVSPGCTHCYAETLSKRNPQTLGVWGPQGTRVIAAESYWRQPLKWDREAKAAGERRRVFCASLADVFEDRGDLLDPRARLFQLIKDTPNLDWLLLTKRPENILPMCYGAFTWRNPNHIQQNEGDGRRWAFPRNVWLGASVENQEYADERRKAFQKVRGSLGTAVPLFVSYEPALGAVNWDGWEFIDWMIVGGESGGSAREFDVDWGRRSRRWCRRNDVAFFMKQMGDEIVDHDASSAATFPESMCWPDGTRYNLHTIKLSKKGGDPQEWPADLRVRQFPTGQMVNVNK